MPQKILLSTDIGSDIDDALSILIMFNSGMPLEGIYTVNGDVTTRAYIAKHMVDLSGKNIDVGIGESNPIKEYVKPYSHFEDAYIDDKFIDDEKSTVFGEIVYKKPKKVGIIANGVENLAKKLSKNKYEVFNIAPLTNIAKLINNYPDVIKNIEHLYIMGCRFSNSKNEHNIRFDSEAAMVVFNSDIPITVIPGDLCEKYKMPIEQLEQLVSPAGKYVKRMALGFIAAKTAKELASADLKEFKYMFPEKFRQNSILDLSTLYKFIEDEMHPKTKNLDKIPKEKALELLNSKRKLLVNLDYGYHATFEKEDYFKQYRLLIQHLENPVMGYEYGSQVANILKMLKPKTISIADLYLPYCYLNPRKIKTINGTVLVDFTGMSALGHGEKHTIVTGIDFDHFKEFLNKNVK